MIDQLPPHAIAALIFQKRRHHFPIAVQDTRALRMVFGHGAEQFCHSGSNPSISASPEERHIGCVIEEAVGLLQLVEIGRHFQRGAVKSLSWRGQSASGTSFVFTMRMRARAAKACQLPSRALADGGYGSAEGLR